VSIYVAPARKISNTLSTFHCRYFANLRLTLESVETQLWVTKAVSQRISSWLARNSKTHWQPKPFSR